MYGRGAGDMKSGLAAMVGAVRGLLRPRGDAARAGPAPVGRRGGVHGQRRARMRARRPHGRRRDPDRADARARSGPPRSACCGSRCACSARPRTPATRRGANAIEATYAVIEALRALEAELNAAKPPLFAAYPHPINLNVGMIRGGDWPSTVAGECLTHFRLALYPGENVADLKARVEQTVAGVRRPTERARLRIEVLYDGFQCEGYELAHDAPLVTGLIDAAARVTGQAPPLFASTATTDARTFHLYGDTPAVCFGPIAESEHGVDERVHLPSVTRPRRRSRCSWPTGAGSRRTVPRTKTGTPILRADSCPAACAASSLFAMTLTVIPWTTYARRVNSSCPSGDRAAARRRRRPRAPTSTPTTAPVPRLRRRHRLPEPRPQPGRHRARDPQAGRPLPAPVLHGRRVRAVRRGLPPARRAVSRPRLRLEALLLNSGAEAVENAVKIARAATGRPAIVAFDRGFHGRTLMTMTLTSKVKPYKKRLRTVRTRGLPHAGAVPVPGHPTEDAIAGLRDAVPRPRRPGDRRRVILEPVQGEGGFIPMPRTSPRACASSARRTGSSGSTTRSRPASAAPGRCGRSSTTTRSRTCSCPASRSAAGCR